MSKIITIAAAALLLAGCASQPPAETIPDPEPTLSLITLDEAKQAANDEVEHLLTFIPEDYIEGTAEITSGPADMQPCELGSKDEWRWGAASNFALTIEGRADYSTKLTAQALVDDGQWPEARIEDDLEQGDPIWLFRADGQSAVVFVQPGDGTGRVFALSPCFSLPGGPVEGEEY